MTAFTSDTYGQVASARAQRLTEHKRRCRGCRGRKLCPVGTDLAMGAQTARVARREAQKEETATLA